MINFSNFPLPAVLKPSIPPAPPNPFKGDPNNPRGYDETYKAKPFNPVLRADQAIQIKAKLGPLRDLTSTSNDYYYDETYKANPFNPVLRADQAIQIKAKLGPLRDLTSTSNDYYYDETYKANPFNPVLRADQAIQISAKLGLLPSKGWPSTLVDLSDPLVAGLFSYAFSSSDSGSLHAVGHLMVLGALTVFPTGATTRPQMSSNRAGN